MNILVFEYIVGGGLAGQSLPPSLAAEGGMMLQALIDDLKSLPDLTLLLPLDQRFHDLSLPPNAQVVVVGENQDVIDMLPELIARCDAVWPIAPESDGLLADIAKQVLAQGKILLLSSPEAVNLCSDKLATYRVLSKNGIPAVHTQRLTSQDEVGSNRCVIKPIDGVGCLGSIIVNNSKAFRQALSGIECPERYVVQPFCDGQAISLSCLFGYGKAWLICCNEQQITIDETRFVLKACSVNIQNTLRDYYRALVERIAIALPQLWGYIGIDIIETPDQGPLVLEINPRMTTSYVGIRQATGINIAEQVLRLLKSEPDIQPLRQRTVNIAIT